jgi:hypothetical protein
LHRDTVGPRQMMRDSPLSIEQIEQLDRTFDRALVETDRLAKTRLVAAAVATMFRPRHRPNVIPWSTLKRKMEARRRPPGLHDHSPDPTA